MKSVLTKTQQELADASARSFRLISALGLATAATLLALLGMMSRYAQGEDAPLPGMDELAGQVGWSVGLGTMMIVSGWLVRNVLMKRLQYAIVASLLLHFLLGMFIQQLGVSFALADRIPQETPNGEPLEELTVPDYGGAELEQPEFDEPVENITEAQAQLERQQTKFEMNREQQEIEANREQNVEAAKVVRAEMDAHQQDVQSLLRRQHREQQQAAAESAEAQPEVTTEAASEAELQARVEAERSQTDPNMAERQMREVEVARADPNVEATDVQRNQVRPDVAPQDVESARRAASAASAAKPVAAENVEVQTAQANDVTAQERATEATRQTQRELPAEQREMQEVATSATQAQVNSVRAGRSANAAVNPSQSAPLAGGAQVARSQTAAGGSTAAANTDAAVVQIASAEGVSSPNVDISSAASQATRGASATVPTGAASRGGGPAATRSTTGVASLGSGGAGRAQTGGGAPRLASAVSNPANTGTRPDGGQLVGAVGTQAGNVAVASATGSRATQSGVLANGPASTRVGRTENGVPNRTGRSAGTGPAVTSNGSGPARVRSGGTTGLTGRSTSPSAQLSSGSGFSGGESGTTGLTRRTAGVALPAGAAAAEQTGNLVMAGPQAAPRVGGGARGAQSGPRTASVPRRTAGLPGLSGPRSSSVGRTRPSLPGRIGTSGLAGRSKAGSPRPALASASELAGLVKRSVPGISAAPLERINAGFSMRRPDVRRDAAKNLGGNDASERAVERGLKWLARHQFADGHWSIHELNCTDHECQGHGSFQSNTAATGLALLAFLGAGYTHQSGEYQEAVRKGLAWLTSHQKKDGDLFTDKSEFVWLYSHGMAAIPLCEAYGMTHDPALKDPAQRALNFVVAAQHPDFGGWRYRPRFESDTSVSGWQLMALKSGEMAGLSVPKSAYDRVSKWLDSVESESSPGRFKYHPSKPVTLAMTAEGLLMRQYLGAKRSDMALTAGANHLKARLPREAQQDAYYWYYATQVMFHMQGEHWSEWNASLRDMLIRMQSKEVATEGSWAPDDAKWGKSGGRHYTTCLNLLMLEVYYRHLPLYIELDK